MAAIHISYKPARRSDLQPLRFLYTSNGSVMTHRITLLYHPDSAIVKTIEEKKWGSGGAGVDVRSACQLPDVKGGSD